MQPNIMIDIETLDIKPTAEILSIGAVIFDSFFIKNEFYVVVTTTSQVGIRTRSPDTSQWWGRQSKQAKQVLVDRDIKGKSLTAALSELSRFCPVDSLVWANGITFDISILENAFENVGKPVPWRYQNIRDYRTVSALFPLEEEGTVAHHALDDARRQAKALIDLGLDLK